MTSSADTPEELSLARAETLREIIHGDVVLPGDEGWPAARQAWQLLADQHPVAVVIANDVHDVVATVRAARERGLHVAPQSTGHGAGAIASLSDTILLRTTRLNEVTIDPVARTARVGAGVVWADVAPPAAEHGLAAVAGMAPSVGVAGFLLGGGLGWFARSHGLGVNSIVSVDVVDAQGRILTLDADNHAELFWAVRGGAAPVVVTALEIRLHPAADLHAGALMWPVERAADVAHAWQEWVAGVPDSVTSLVRVLRYPPIPEIPEFLRDRSFVAVEAAMQADAAAVAELLTPLRALSPELDSIRPLSPDELGSVHGDPPQPSGGYGGAVVLSEISRASVDAFVDAAVDAAATPLISIELRHLGGQLTPGRMDGGVVSSIDGAGLVYAVGIVPSPGAVAPVRAATERLLDALRPFAAGTVVKNFTESPASASDLYGDAAGRLRDIVDEWDPERVFSIAHPLD